MARYRTASPWGPNQQFGVRRPERAVDLMGFDFEEFDELLDECNSKIPFGDFAYTYSECYKKVDPVAYGMALYDWIDSNGYMKGEKIRTYGTVAIGRFNLLNLFSSRMKAKQLHEAYIYMIATAHYYSGQYRYGDEIHFDLPERMHLGGTPLNSTLFTSFSVMR